MVKQREKCEGTRGWYLYKEKKGSKYQTECRRTGWEAEATRTRKLKPISSTGKKQERLGEHPPAAQAVEKRLIFLGTEFIGINHMEKERWGKKRKHLGQKMRISPTMKKRKRQNTGERQRSWKKGGTRDSAENSLMQVKVERKKDIKVGVSIQDDQMGARHVEKKKDIPPRRAII